MNPPGAQLLLLSTRSANGNLESVIWFGDFNYRIGLGNERTKDLIRQRNLEGLYENDQVITTVALPARVGRS